MSAGALVAGCDVSLGRRLRCIGPVVVARLAAEAAALGRQVQSADAVAFAANVLPIIESLRASGVRDLRSLAAALNNRGVRTARGRQWHVSNVKNLVDRLSR